MTAVAGGITQAADITALALLTTGRPIVRLIQQSAQPLTTAVTAALTFGASSEDIDTHNFHDPVTNTTRITPTTAGYYRCTSTFAITASTAITQFYTAVGKNGISQQPLVRMKPGAANTATSVVAIAVLACNGSGDYFEAFAQQTSGGTLNTQASGGINSVFEVEYLRPL